MELEELLKKLANSLEDLDIKYCITGGYAVSVWGRPRSTFDIDVVIQLKIKDIVSLMKSLRLLSRAGYIEEAVVREATIKGGEFNFIHPESGIKIDFWVIKENDPTGINELKRRVEKKFDSQTIYFISPEDLILSKLRWFKETNSERHLEDVESVIKISGDKIDKKYLRQQAANLGFSEILNKYFNK